MNRNPNKPRLLRNENVNKAGETAAESFFGMTGDSRVNMNPLTEMTVSEQAGILVTDTKTREELLASLHGKRKD